MSELLTAVGYLDQQGVSQLYTEIAKNFVAQVAGKGLSANDFTNELLEKLNSIKEGAQVNVIESIEVNGAVVDIVDKKVTITVPTGALANLDKVGQEHLDETLLTLLTGKADKANTLAGYGITDAYTKGETEQKIKAAVSSTYKAKGSILFNELPTEGMEAGDMYNIKDAFVTTDAFVEGAGVSYPAGTNVAYTVDGKWDCMTGIFDFSEFLMKNDIRSLTTEEIIAACQLPTV